MNMLREEHIYERMCLNYRVAPPTQEDFDILWRASRTVRIATCADPERIRIDNDALTMLDLTLDHHHD